jgi:[ribosomal protein S5]-alanine N-acetyltransferase
MPERSGAKIDRSFVLQTPHLALRELRAADAPFILRLLNDPAWLRFIGDRGVRTVEGAREYLETRMISTYAKLGFGLWMVEPRAGGPPMGICGLVKRDQLPEVDLGFAFMPEFRGQGHAYESALAVRDHGIRALGLARLLAITSPANADSVRLLERLGFARERDMPWAGDEKDMVTVYAYES